MNLVSKWKCAAPLRADPEDTTQALMLTEGSITSVQPASLSDLTNVSVLGQ